MLVVLICGMLSAIAIPSMLKSRDAAELVTVAAGLRTVHTNQIMYRSQRGRFARLAELNSFAGNTMGSTVGTTVVTKKWVYMMMPAPTDATLRSTYQIIAVRTYNGVIDAQFSIAQDGAVQTWISPGPAANPTPTPRPK